MGLCFKRKAGQSFWINKSLKVIVHEVSGKWVAFRFEGAHEFEVDRTERIQNALGVLSCKHAKQICPKCLEEVLDEVKASLGGKELAHRQKKMAEVES